MSKLREAREDAGHTLEELAELIGSSKSYMWQIENKADPQPTVRMAYQLSRILGVPIEALFEVGLTAKVQDNDD